MAPIHFDFHYLKNGMKQMKRYPIVVIAAALAMVLMVSACSQKSAPAANRQQAEAIRELGEAYMAEGNYAMALRELLRAKELSPNDPYLHNSLGLTYMARGRHQTAVSHFKRAVELNPNYAPAKNNLGSAYISMEEWGKAIDAFESVKDDLLYATPYYPLSNLGYVHYRMGEYEEAKRYYREALDMERRFPRALHGLGLVALATGDTDEAIRRFEETLEETPNAGHIYMDLARAYEQRHEYSKALNTYEQAAAIGRDTRLQDEAEEAMRELRRRW